MVSMFNNDKIYVCYYGTRNNPELIEKINKCVGENFNVPYPEYSSDTSTSDLFLNLWKCSVTKMDVELTNKIFFNAVMAINLDDEIIIQKFLDKMNAHKFFRPENLKEVKRDTVYFCMGSLIGYKTTINPSIFFADSSTFGIAANYGLVRNRIAMETDLAFSSGPMKELKNRLVNDHIYFYNFLKSHKLKTECVNYEDSSMFERST